MKSKITIDYDPSNGQSKIVMVLNKSEDVRDKMVQSFVEQLGFESSWCHIDVDPYADTNDPRTYTIRPVPSGQLAVMWRNVFGRIPQFADFPVDTEELIRQLCLFHTQEPVEAEMVERISEVLSGKPSYLPGVSVVMNDELQRQGMWYELGLHQANHYLLREGDKIMDMHSHAIGVVKVIKDVVLIKAVNMVVFDSKKHFLKGTTAVVIERTADKKKCREHGCETELSNYAPDYCPDHNDHNRKLADLDTILTQHNS